MVDFYIRNMVEEMIQIVSDKAQEQRFEFQGNSFDQQIVNYIDNFNYLSNFLLKLNIYFEIIENNDIQLEKTKPFINKVVSSRPTLQLTENTTSYIPEFWATKIQDEPTTYNYLSYYKPIYETADRQSYLESTQIDTARLIVQYQNTQIEMTYTIPIQSWHKQFDKEIKVKSTLASPVLLKLFVATEQELDNNLCKLADSGAIIRQIQQFANENQLLWLQKKVC